MAKKRKFAAYRALERPYTRFSKFRSKNYIRARPNSRIVRMKMGNLKDDFPVTLELSAKSALQIRDNALESARLAANRRMEKLGKSNYRLELAPYPHHVLRENPLASGAGADRMSTGMKMSFGKTIGRAAQIDKGQVIFRIHTKEQFVDAARHALRRAYTKLPCSCSINIIRN